MALTASSLVLYNGGVNTTVIGGFVGVSISGNTAGVTSLISSGTAQFFGGNNITLSQNGQSVSIIGGAGGAGGTQTISGGGTSISGTAISLDLEAGPFISLQSASGVGSLTLTISGSNQSVLYLGSSIAGGSFGGTQNTASSTAISFVAGGNIGISQVSTSPNITISGRNQVSSISLTTAANGSTTGVLANITGPLVLVAGNQITLSQNTGTGTNSTLSSGSNAIVISGPSFSAGANIAITSGSVISIAGANIVSSLNGSSGALSISAGAGIGIGQANSTITISASASGTVLSGFQISGNTSGTSSLITNGTVYLQAVSMLGLSQSTTTGTGSTTSNVVSIFGPTYSAGAGLAVSTTGGVVSYSISNQLSSLNGSSGTLSISAGAGIGIGQANSTITVSASIQTSSLSVTALGNTLGAASTSLAISNALNISGAGIVSVGMNGSTITISASTAALPNVVTSLNGSNGSLSISAGANIGIGQANSTITISASNQSVLRTIATAAGGATLGTLNTASSTAYALVAGSNITLSQNSTSPNITILGPTPGAGGSVLTVEGVGGGATSGALNTASSTAFALIAGTNIILSQDSTSPNITVSAVNQVKALSPNGLVSSTGTINLSGALGIVISSGPASNIRFSVPALSVLSVTEAYPLSQAGGVIASTSGTVTGIGSSLFLQRIALAAPMNLSEVDIALGIAFPATNQGAGTMSQSMVMYSLNGTTELDSVFSASSAFVWSTGTSTTAGATSITQFQGGWSVPKLHPFTFASTVMPAGEYVVGHLLNFAQGSSTWTVSLFGELGSLGQSTTITAFTATPTAANALSSGGLAAVSAFTASGSASVLSNAGTALANILSTSGTAAATLLKATVATTASTTGSAVAMTAWTAAPSNLARTLFTAAPTAVAVMSSNGLSVGSFVATSGSAAVISNAGTGSINPLFPTVPSFAFFGTGSTTAALPNVFLGGIMSTSSVPGTISLSNTALTYTGSAVNAQPWFALVGS